MIKKTGSGISCHVVMDSRGDKNDLHKIIFRIYENRLKRDLFTGVRWPKAFYDAKNQLLMPRYAGDPDVVPYNLKLNEFKARAHRMALSGYLDKTDLTLEDIVNEFRSMHLGEDFFAFMLARTNELYNQDTIVNATWRRHKCSLNILKKFCKRETLSIGAITLDFIERFDAWARTKHKAGHNTVCGYHKDIKKFLGFAVRKCIIAKNPYDDFSFAYEDGDRQALNQEEICRLIALLKKPKLEANDKEICTRFLFSCFTGLRISDTSLVHSNMIKGEVLSFIPYKGRGKGKILRLPLQKIAQQLIEGREGLLFQKFSHSYINERLKIIAARADIFKRLTYHCARDTFGTQAVEMNIHIKLISEMMGHSSLKTTSIYLKMSEEEKKRAMGKFDERFQL